MADTDPNKRTAIILKYTEGKCGILALALHEASGFDVVAIKDQSGNHWHFGVRDGDSYWDIRGRLPASKFLEGWSIYRTLHIRKISPRTVLRLYRKISDEEKTEALADFRELEHEPQIHQRSR